MSNKYYSSAHALSARASFRQRFRICVISHLRRNNACHVVSLIAVLCDPMQCVLWFKHCFSVFCDTLGYIMHVSGSLRDTMFTCHVVTWWRCLYMYNGNACFFMQTPCMHAALSTWMIVGRHGFSNIVMCIIIIL